MEPLFPVIHEDADLLVINKPAGLVCHPTKGDERSSLIGRVRLHLGPDAQPHLVNRLDRETSGVILVAKHNVPARALRRLWEAKSVQKEYWAIVHGSVAADTGDIQAPLGPDSDSLIAIKDRVCAAGQGAASRTEFSVLRRFHRDGRDFTWLQVSPHTGRKHQIRIHLAHLGHPLVGDKLYGGDEDLYLALVQDRLTPEQRQRLIFPHHALHARSLQFNLAGRDHEFTADPEPWFTHFLAPL